jgi:hypothetical protein
MSKGFAGEDVFISMESWENCLSNDIEREWPVDRNVQRHSASPVDKIGRDSKHPCGGCIHGDSVTSPHNTHIMSPRSPFPPHTPERTVRFVNLTPNPQLYRRRRSKGFRACIIHQPSPIFIRVGALEHHRGERVPEWVFRCYCDRVAMGWRSREIDRNIRTIRLFGHAVAVPTICQS